MSAVIFSGNSVRALKASLQLDSGITLTTGSGDPTSGAVTGSKGDAYFSTSTGIVYIKQDSGSSTNWQQYVVGAAGDIAHSTFTIANNILSVANVTGLSFSAASVRSAKVYYSIYRSTSLFEFGEAGEMTVVYKNTLGTWALINTFGGDDAGIVFTITNAGQVQYTSTNILGSAYAGNMKFRALVTTQ